MATKTTAQKASSKVAKASKALPKHQAHGALAPSPVNMNELFGIKSVYTARTIDEYRGQLDKYMITDLHAHAHHVGVIPLDPREKLVSVLERKFMEVQSKNLPLQFVPVKANKDMLDFHKKFMAGTLR